MGRVTNPTSRSGVVCWGTWLSYLGKELRHRGKSPGPPKLSLHTHGAHPPPLPSLSKTHFLSLLPLVENCLSENLTPPQALGTEREWESGDLGRDGGPPWQGSVGCFQFALAVDIFLRLRLRAVGQSGFKPRNLRGWRTEAFFLGRGGRAAPWGWMMPEVLNENSFPVLLGRCCQWL